MFIYLLFTICSLLIIYTYIFYPAYLRKNAIGKKMKFSPYLIEEELPMVKIIIPICNEEKIIENKINSIISTSYPVSKITIYVGLDNCTDSTLEIIHSKFSLSTIAITEFSERQGKPAVLNQIVNQLPQDDSILIFTDADVLFTHNTIFELVKYFKNKEIGLVDSSIKPGVIRNSNEQAYWNYETEIKQNESLVFGSILGPSGGCYAIRRNLFVPIPPNFLVDDFFIGFSIAVANYKTILNPSAVCYEDVTTNWSQEFRRKMRIAAGNFQNLWYFKKYAFQPHTNIGKIFISHKVLRWKTPFFLLIIYYILLLKYTLFILIVTLFLPIIDALLFTFGFEFKPLRRFHYFIVMNIAVFIGFIKFCKGIRTNVWQPTTRNGL